MQLDEKRRQPYKHIIHCNLVLHILCARSWWLVAYSISYLNTSNYPSSSFSTSLYDTQFRTASGQLSYMVLFQVPGQGI